MSRGMIRSPIGARVATVNEVIGSIPKLGWSHPTNYCHRMDTILKLTMQKYCLIRLQNITVKVEVQIILVKC